MLSGIIKVIILVAMVIFIGWAGACVYRNFIAEPDTGQPGMPNPDKAAYSVHIENTGNLILTNDYEVHGSEVGSRVFSLHGFWEIRGQKFVYKNTDIILDERIFGEITIKRRQSK